MRVSSRSWAALWLPVAVWCGVIFAMSSVPDLSSGLEYDYPLRKCAHMLEYAVLWYLFRRAARGSGWPRPELLAAAFSVLYAALDECHQAFVPGRHGVWTDVLIDGCGAALCFIADRQGVFMFSDERRPPESLVLLAARLRTERQLRRLSRLPSASGDRVSFAVLGDAEPSRFWIYRKLFNREGVFHDQMHELQSMPLTFTVQLGDMVSKGLVSNYDAFLRGLRRVWSGRPYLTVIGNHDRSRPNGKSHSALYRGLFGKPNYFFDHAGVRFVVLDSSAKRVTRTQLKWLKMALAVPGRKIVFTHMPPVQLGLWGGVGRVHELGGFIGGSREFADAVTAAKVSRVYMGHVHAFGVQDHGGVRYVLTGGGGSALFPSGNRDRFHHFLTVEIGPGGIRERVHTLDGRVFAIPRGVVILPTHEAA